MKILILNPIDPDTIDTLSKQHDVICAFNTEHKTLKSLIQDRELLIFRSGVSIDSELMQCAPDLKWLIRAGSGMDNIDLDYVKKRGLKFERIPKPSALAVSEMSFTLMLALSRRLFEADRSMRQGRWLKNDMVGSLLNEKVLGVIGVGNIGTRVAELGVAWDMKVIGCVEYPTPERANQMKKKKIILTDFDTVISTADYVTIHVPLKKSTRYLVDARALSKMKPGAVLINLARGGVVDEKALYHTLVSGNGLSAAALDVHEHEGDGMLSPFSELQNVILTPHIGAMVAETQRQIGEYILELVESFIA
jgi:phosphoglycerate dehydrogenase-like enzyme